jgi:steroid 5-alpha reductase family enzyme
MVGAVSCMSVALMGAAGCHRDASGTPLRTGLLTTLAVAWSVRLGVHGLLKRTTRTPEPGASPSPQRTARHWLMQAAWIWLASLPLVLLNAADLAVRAASRPATVWRANPLDVLGWLLWAVGLYVETRAEHERHVYSVQPRSERALPFLATGLWGFCRHPSLLGTLLVAWGGWLSAAQGVWHWSGLLAAASVLVPALLTRRCVTSLIPRQEAKADRLHSRLLAYQQYKAITSPLIPLSPRVYAFIHPKVKRAVFWDTNTVAVGKVAGAGAAVGASSNAGGFVAPLPKMKPGEPIQYSTHIAR